MKRGDIVTGSAARPPASKRRPYIVVQSDLTSDRAVTLTVCPLTAQPSGASLYRVPIAASAGNRLDRDSEAAADLVQTLARDQLTATGGHIETWQVSLIDQALRFHLDL